MIHRLTLRLGIEGLSYGKGDGYKGHQRQDDGDRHTLTRVIELERGQVHLQGHDVGGVPRAPPVEA